MGPWPTSSRAAKRPCPTCTLTQRQAPTACWPCCRQRYSTVRRFTMRWEHGGVFSRACLHACLYTRVCFAWLELGIHLSVVFAWFHLWACGTLNIYGYADLREVYRLQNQMSDVCHSGQQDKESFSNIMPVFESFHIFFCDHELAWHYLYCPDALILNHLVLQGG